MLSDSIKKDTNNFLKMNRLTKDWTKEYREDFHSHLCKIFDSHLDIKRAKLHNSITEIMGKAAQWVQLKPTKRDKNL